MKRRNVGNAHVIIVIVLVVALLGALGFIFYQNFIAKKTDTGTGSPSKTDTNSRDEKVAKVNTKTLAMTTVFANGLSLSYPETWSVTHEPVQGEVPATDTSTTIDSYAFTSPDSTVKLTLRQASGGGIGGACNPDEETTLTTYGYEASSVWSGHAYVESSFADRESGGVFVQQSITAEASAKTLQAGDSVCSVRFFNVDQTNRFVGSNNQILLFSSVINTDDPASAFHASSAEAAKEYLASQNAKDIKAILLSIH